MPTLVYSGRVLQQYAYIALGSDSSRVVVNVNEWVHKKVSLNPPNARKPHCSSDNLVFLHHYVTKLLRFRCRLARKALGSENSRVIQQ